MYTIYSYKGLEYDIILIENGKKRGVVITPPFFIYF